MIVNESQLSRFMSKVAKTDSCWNWVGCRSQGGKGYGEFWLDGRVVQASRASFEHHVATLPDGMYALHSCDNRACVNPKHLRPGTQSENILEMVSRGRCHNAKLNDDQVREIRQSRESSTILAERYGISAAHARKVRQGVSKSNVL